MQHQIMLHQHNATLSRVAVNSAISDITTLKRVISNNATLNSTAATKTTLK